MHLLALFAVVILPVLARATSRTGPPSGALVVDPVMGPYMTLSAAVAALPNDGSAQTIFVYPGTYVEQVLIKRSGAVTVCVFFPIVRSLPFSVLVDLRVHVGYDGSYAEYGCASPQCLACDRR